MNQVDLLQKLAAGNANVAERLGIPYSHYRPSGAYNPMASTNMLGQLDAYLLPIDKLQEKSQWVAWFDCSKTLPGDYLVTSAGVTYFIGSQVAFAPLMCVLTNASVSLVRPVSVTSADTAGYSGVVTAFSDTLLTGWPASLTASGRAKAGPVPDDEGLSGWVILLPALPVEPLVADLLIDNLERTFVVTSAELTGLGWQVHAKQVSS